jgi:hypothetical protein
LGLRVSIIVVTRLTVTAVSVQANAELKRFIEAMDTTKTKGDDGSHFDFEGVYPMPEGLDIPAGAGTSAGLFALTGDNTGQNRFWTNPLTDGMAPNGVKTVEQYKEHLEKTNPEALRLGALALDNARKYGHATWYEWKCANWGTKWGAYGQGEWEVFEGTENTLAHGIIHYNTAWSPATAFYLKVSKDYPNLQFKHEFADEGGGFLGYEIIENGAVVSEGEFKWNSLEGRELREMLTGDGGDEEEELS